ncbi:hypothetical protein F383_22712 [Gossypium arboreum]|uniref:Uncharacterized protein n=1 Tax=Gossypium arboreum TaxID=29729 RepID=A0A0B0NUR5_GOSAR|nr:hypothetical protein F383_22712 [Gossypium arboreum]
MCRYEFGQLYWLVIFKGLSGVWPCNLAHFG